MKKHEGAKREFYWSNKAWYGRKNEANEIYFGLYHYKKDGQKDGTSGEMRILWETQNKREVPQLQVFDDAWSALSRFHDVIDKLAEYDDRKITPEQFVQILKSCGFRDRTAYKEENTTPQKISRNGCTVDLYSECGCQRAGYTKGTSKLTIGGLVLSDTKKFPHKCSGCGVSPWEIHQTGCVIEPCSVCGCQRVSCGCKGHDMSFARWSGFLPGSLEAEALGLDMTEFYRKGYHKVFFVKPKLAIED